MIDNDQGSTGAGVEGLTTPASWVDPALTRGVGATDIPRALRVNLLYHLPNFVGSEGPKAKLVNGWWVSSIFTAQDGLPFDPLVGYNVDRSGPNGSGPNDFTSIVTPANLAAAQAIDPLAVVYNPATVIQGGTAHYFNPHMFTVPPYGYFGDDGRGLLRGPGLLDLDASLVKDTKVAFLGEAGAVEFRAEFFNAINHPNFGEPSASIFSTSGVLSTAGQIGGMVNSNAEREIQFALKVLF